METRSGRAMGETFRVEIQRHSNIVVTRTARREEGVGRGWGTNIDASCNRVVGGTDTKTKTHGRETRALRPQPVGNTTRRGRHKGGVTPLARARGDTNLVHHTMLEAIGKLGGHLAKELACGGE
jgi:hypothetical protein